MQRPIPRRTYVEGSGTIVILSMLGPNGAPVALPMNDKVVDNPVAVNE